MKLFFSAGACSIGIHILLREIGKPFELHEVNTKAGGTRTPAYLAMNPKGKVPALVRDDGTILTEFPAIAFYLAWANPSAGLLPADIEGQSRCLELFEYLVSTVHMRGLHRMYGPTRLAYGADPYKVYDDGEKIVEDAFAILEPELEGKSFLLGEFSIVDCALFYVLINAHRLRMTLPPNLARHLQTMLERPTVIEAMRVEDISAWAEVAA